MDYPERIKRQLARGLVGWQKGYEACDPHNSEKKKGAWRDVEFYRNELGHFVKEY